MNWNNAFTWHNEDKTVMYMQWQYPDLSDPDDDGVPVFKAEQEVGDMEERVVLKHLRSDIIAQYDACVEQTRGNT